MIKYIHKNTKSRKIKNYKMKKTLQERKKEVQLKGFKVSKFKYTVQIGRKYNKNTNRIQYQYKQNSNINTNKIKYKYKKDHKTNTESTVQKQITQLKKLRLQYTYKETVQKQRN